LDVHATKKEPVDNNFKVVFVGAGAIGGSLAAWIARYHEATWVLGRGAAIESLRSTGITTYPAHHPDQRDNIKVKIIDNLGALLDTDVVVLAVKLYDLDAAASLVKETLGDRPIVVGMQNGVENQVILPRYFSRSIYCVVAYNAWRDASGVIGYQQKGPLVLGTPDNRLQDEIRTVADIFSPGIQTIVTNHFQDAVYSKLIINLANSITTLVGLNYRPINDIGLFQAILSNMVYEGVQVLKAAGFREFHLAGIPSWTTLWAAARLPNFLTQRTFKKNMQKMVISSMGQDVLQHKSAQTELEYLNGYFISLADRYGCRVPYNRAVYRLCQQHFSQPDFKPLDVNLVWDEIRQQAAR
jgi:2-dehydropantoate 2-reductase